MNEATPVSDTVTLPKRQFLMLVIYAVLLTLFLAFAVLTGRLGTSSELESLPDVKPLQPGEFQHVDPTAALPANHEMQIGETRRFGDVEVTITKVTQEPVSYVHMTGRQADDRTTEPVLHVWMDMKNVSGTTAFPPFDVELMCQRSPRESSDAATAKANSWLKLDDQSDRLYLNLFHPRNSEYDLQGQQSRKVVAPGESLTTFVAASPEATQAIATAQQVRWRIQIRKGVNSQSNHGVTTLVDVAFTPDQIQS